MEGSFPHHKYCSEKYNIGSPHSLPRSPRRSRKLGLRRLFSMAGARAAAMPRQSPITSPNIHRKLKVHAFLYSHAYNLAQKMLWTGLASIYAKTSTPIYCRTVKTTQTGDSKTERNPERSPKICVSPMVYHLHPWRLRPCSPMGRQG